MRFSNQQFVPCGPKLPDFGQVMDIRVKNKIFQPAICTLRFKVARL